MRRQCSCGAPAVHGPWCWTCERTPNARALEAETDGVPSWWWAVDQQALEGSGDDANEHEIQRRDIPEASGRAQAQALAVLGMRTSDRL